MGLNYERGVAEALHSFGHRTESALRHVFERWDIHNTDPNDWELFTAYDMEVPGGAHVGNIHFPPNGQQDYDYGNPNYVITFADNWKRYPYLLDETRSVNCLEWNCNHPEYMRWWFRRLPRFAGVTDNILSNWWYYMLDYESAVDSATAQGGYVGIPPRKNNPITRQYFLDQNFPNPFNSSTVIRFTVSSTGFVRLKIFDLLGREVAALVDDKLRRGKYSVGFDANELSSGIYFYRLTAGNRATVRKMLLVR